MAKLFKGSNYWWVLMIEGVVQLVIGFMLLFSTDMTVFLLVQLLGIYWLIRGLIMIVQMFIGKEKHKTWLLLGGLLGVAAGIVVLRYPLFSSFILLEFLVVLIAFVGIVQGLISLYRGITYNGVGEALLGIILLLVGLMLLANPFSSVIALPIAIGIIWVIGGASITMLALAVRK